MKKVCVTWLVGMSLLASCGGGEGVNGGNTGVSSSHAVPYTLCGTQLDAAGNPVVGATVSIVASSSVYKATTNDKGEYTRTIPAHDAGNLPDTFTYSVSKAGYVPITYARTKTDANCQNSIPMVLLDSSVILFELEPLTHHLGDGAYSGETNSKFQYLQAQGKTFIKTFDLKDQPNEFLYADITFMHKGVQYDDGFRDFVTFNSGTSLFIPNSDPNGDFLPYGQRISASVFKANQANELIIGSDNKGGPDYDDFEFQNVVIKFRN